MGINNEFPEGVKGHGLNLTSDSGSQPTATSFMRRNGNTRVANQHLTIMTTTKRNTNLIMCLLVDRY